MKIILEMIQEAVKRNDKKIRQDESYMATASGRFQSFIKFVYLLQ